MIQDSCKNCPYDNPSCLKCKLGYLRVHEDMGMIRPYICKMHDAEVPKEAQA